MNGLGVAAACSFCTGRLSIHAGLAVGLAVGFEITAPTEAMIAFLVPSLVQSYLSQADTHPEWGQIPLSQRFPMLFHSSKKYFFFSLLFIYWFERDREINVLFHLLMHSLVESLYVPWPRIELTTLEYQDNALTSLATWSLLPEAWLSAWGCSSKQRENSRSRWVRFSAEKKATWC